MHVVDAAPPGAEEATRPDACRRAANYLAAGQTHLMDDPLPRQPLTPEQVKPRLLGHRGTTPGLNLIHARLSRIVAARNHDLISVTGPGHGGPGLVANACVSLDARGMGRPFTHRAHTRRTGEDLPGVRGRAWPAG